ncbi:MAG: WG repeat-containing protein [Pyrinomonadaceae bacterium]
MSTVALLCAAACCAVVVCPAQRSARDRAHGEARDGAGDAVALFPVPEGDRWGYKDRAGRWAIRPQYQSANPFVAGMAEVWQDDLKFYVRADGTRVEDRNFASDHFSEGLMPVRVGDKYGFADAEGRLVVFPRFDYAGDFGEGLAPVKIKDKWGYVARDGGVKIAPQFDDASRFSEGLASVCYEIAKPKTEEERVELLPGGGDTNKRCGYVNKSGEVVIAPQYNEAGDFSEGLAAVRVGRRGNVIGSEDEQTGKWGYIDRAGGVVMPLQFQNAHDFAEGLAPVKIGAKWGYVDAGGKTVIPPRFEWAQSFSGGLALVAVGEPKTWWPRRGVTALAIGLKGKYGYIDKTGEFVSDKLTWKGKWKKR